MSGDPASRASNNHDSVLAKEKQPDMGVAPNCPSAEGSENMFVTNSEVASAMDHRHRKAVLRNPRFSKEAFGAFSSADAYIRAARDGLNRATEQHLKDVQVSLSFPNLITMCP